MNCKKCGENGIFSGRHKVCNKCRAKAARDKYPSVCEAKLARYKERAAEISKSNRLKKYGLTQEEYLGKLIAQNGKCAICKNLMRSPCVDHAHDSGKVRSLLCSNCNRALGLFGEDVERLREAIEYIEFWEKR